MSTLLPRPSEAPTRPAGALARVSRGRLLLLALLGLVSWACQDGKRAPVTASSAEQPAYAERYPDELEALEQDLRAEGETVAQATSEISKYPDALDKPNWELVETVYNQAHEEGKGAAYDQRFREATTVSRFFEQEKKPLVNRVAGGAQHAAKEKQCDVQLHGPVAFSLERGVEQQLTDRRRADSTAQRTIEEQKDGLGKKNVATLQTQADALALASHLVYVRWETDRMELSARVDEASKVRSTLEDRREALANAAKPDPEALARVDAALGAIDQRVEAAKAALEGGEERAKKQRSDYEAAFAALIDQVERRAAETKE